MKQTFSSSLPAAARSAQTNVQPYLIQVQGEEQEDQQVADGHATQVQVGGASHVWAEPYHQNG